MITRPAILPLRNLLWLGFFGVILVAWTVLYQMAGAMDIDLIGRQGAMEQAMRRMGPGIAMARYWPLAAMWALMMAAMMLPTLVPTLRAYGDLMVSANGTRTGWLGVVAGFLAAWVGFAALIAAAQLTLLKFGLIDGLGIATTGWFAAALLVGVGLYQFSRAKAACHGVCHAPAMYFLGHWRSGFGGGLRMGLGLGAFCVGCCWGFMALGFVGGVMSLLWMGLATLFMVIEKLPDIGHRVTRPMGVILVLAGFGLAAHSLSGSLLNG